MKVYAVMRIDSKLQLSDTNVDCKLPEGQFIIPCYADEEKAKQMAGDEFEIVIFETNK